MDGSVLKKILQREAWTKYLDTKAKESKERRSPESVQSALNLVTYAIKNNPITDKADLHRRIVNIIETPSEEWKLRRRQYELSQEG